MGRKVIIFTILFLLIIKPTLGLTKDYFLYDHEQNEILTINDALPTESLKKIGLTKNPDLMMATGVTDKFLAVHSSYRIMESKGQVSFQPGRLMIFNAKSGRTEDLVEIGFAPYHWTYTKDRSCFFIAYYSSPKRDQVEILQYDINKAKLGKVSGIGREIVDLKLSLNDNTLLALVNLADFRQEIVTFELAPFQIKSKLTVEPNAQHLFILGPDRAALVGFNSQRRKTGSGMIKIIDTFSNAIVEERKLNFPSSGVYWYEKNRSLFVTNGIMKGRLMKGRIYKITGAGIRQHQIPRPWAGFSYLPEQDKLYILDDAGLTLIDYAQNFSKNFSLGESNYYPGQYRYYFQRLAETNLALIASFEKGYLKFYDLEKNQVLKNAKCGRTGELVLNVLSFKGDLESRTMATTNQWQSRFYVLNCATRDITVYDQTFNVLKYLIFEEQPLAMFQVNHPTLRTLVITTKQLYLIDEENVVLIPIADFSTQISQVKYFAAEKDAVLIHTDRLLMVLEPENFKVKHQFYLYGNPEEKYTKLRNQERRYYFIPEM
ncbi:MAG: hypothetical protein ACM3YE_17880 [Bacteroidota bacterium]